MNGSTTISTAKVAMVAPQVKDTLVPQTLKRAKTKVCSSCGKELPLEKFNRHGRSKDGYTHECIECIGRRHLSQKSDALNPLAKFTARELMHELHNRGYEGDITFIQVHKIKLSDM